MDLAIFALAGDHLAGLSVWFAQITNFKAPAELSFKFSTLFLLARPTRNRASVRGARSFVTHSKN